MNLCASNKSVVPNNLQKLSQRQQEYSVTYKKSKRSKVENKGRAHFSADSVTDLLSVEPAVIPDYVHADW